MQFVVLGPGHPLSSIVVTGTYDIMFPRLKEVKEGQKELTKESGNEQKLKRSGK